MTITDIIRHVGLSTLSVSMKVPQGGEYRTDYYTTGVEYACFRDGKWDENFVRQISDAAKRFSAHDYGSTDNCYRMIPGRELGRYPSKYGPIWIKRDRPFLSGMTVTGFDFERMGESFEFIRK